MIMSSIKSKKSRKAPLSSKNVISGAMTSRVTRARSPATTSTLTRADVHQRKRQTGVQSIGIDKSGKKARISKRHLANSVVGEKQLRVDQSPNKAGGEARHHRSPSADTPTLHKRKRFKPVAEEGANRPGHNRNKGQPTTTISTYPFLEREAEETKTKPRSSHSSATSKKSKISVHHRPKTTASKESDSQILPPAKRTRKSKTTESSTSSSTHSSIIKRASISRTRQIRTRNTTKMAKAKKDSKPSQPIRDTLPKRKASLDAHSAMLALTLQMQRPISKGTPMSPTRKRTESIADTVQYVASTSSAKKDKDKPKKVIRQKRTSTTTSPVTKRKTSQPVTPVSSPKKLDSVHGAPIFQHPHVQCTCQSPPTCPVHYQLHCACHHAQFHQATAQAQSSLISSIFPFQTTAPTSGASLPHYASHQPWTSPQPWPFSTPAHVLATVATPNTSSASISGVETGGLSGGYPAVFQGHLFIGAHPHHLNTQPFNQLAPNPLFVTTEHCPNITLHPPQPPTHPSPPLSTTCDQSPFDQSEASTSDMVASKNKIVYELINHGVDMPSLTLKFAKKPNTETPTSPKSPARKRKSSSTSSGEDHCGAKKSKRTKSTRKSFDFDQGASIVASSLWEPIGSHTRKWVYVNNDSKPIRRDCYSAIRHKVEMDTVIRVRDCIVVKSSDSSQSQQSTNTKRTFVAKVADFFTNPTNGSLWVSLVWYYWPEQAEVTSIDDRFLFDTAHPKELFASRHIDCVSVDSIEDVAYVVSLNEYNRYIAENKAESFGNIGSVCDELIPRAWGAYPRRRLMPAEDTDDALVYFCRRVYDFHGKRILRNPSF